MSFLGFASFAYADLFSPAKLADLLSWFDRELEAKDSALFGAYRAYHGGAAISAPEESELLCRVSKHVESFLGERFAVGDALASLVQRTKDEEPRFRFKREIVTRRIRLKRKPEEFERLEPSHTLRPLGAILDAFVAAELTRSPAAFLSDAQLDERAVAALALCVWDLHLPLTQVKGETPVALVSAAERLRADITSTADSRHALAELGVDVAVATGEWVAKLLEVIERGVALRLFHPAARVHVRDWVSLIAPREIHYEHLVEVERPDRELPELLTGHAQTQRERPGFRMTDPGYDRLQVLDQTHYCIFCHPREKDSCSKGMKQKEGGFKKNPLGIALEGCPLEEKISEFQRTRSEGFSLAALALIAIDNPMCPGTGHRICNDCMKGCIYQKQSPVNIPQTETGVLTEVLNLPWGVEIYGLLTRWNPLNRKRPVALPHNGKKVLVVGLGPAGYTLAHHLVNDGFGVVAIDGLKLEPLPEAWLAPTPIRDWASIAAQLDERVVSGFGGVSEYGITVRWDKNFLTLLYLTLARREKFMALGGVRFGGTLDLDDAWALGFDHVAIASGAGRPTIVDMKNNLLRGIRKASDFLMALQLTGAFKPHAIANLQVRLPGIVIGGGLTGIDTATEMLAYYVVQVERTLARHDTLLRTKSELEIFASFNEEELFVYREFLEHGRRIRSEREKAHEENRQARIVPLLKEFGGVALVYRKTLEDSPAYRLNHEEIEKGLEEGIVFIECMNPVEALADQYGALRAVTFERVKKQEGKFVNSGEMVTLAAHTMAVAAGTNPNTMYEKEYTGTFALDHKRGFFKNHRVVGGRVEETADGSGFFTSYLKDGHTVSYYGDNHPVYAGSVVKAMASAKDGAPQVTALYASEFAALAAADQPAREASWVGFAAKVNEELRAQVVRVDRLTDTIVEVIVKAPMAARKFLPGQFYRLQNFERTAKVVRDTPLVMEGLALTGAWTDPAQGLLSMIVLEMGGSSRLCMQLQKGEEVVVMGPTGAPTEIPHNETVVLCGGGLGNAVLFSIARALKDNGCRVLYFAAYRQGTDVFHMDEIERATDQVIWSTDGGAPVVPRRPQDSHFRGNVVQAMLAFAQGELGSVLRPLSEATRFIVIGSDRMMAAVTRARHHALAKFLNPEHIAVGSINSPMQCMMKEICAQCLQKHVDPKTGAESYVFTCFNQDQLLDHVDFGNLDDRLRQNSVQEKQIALYLDHLLAV